MQNTADHNFLWEAAGSLKLKITLQVFHSLLQRWVQVTGLNISQPIESEKEPYESSDFVVVVVVVFYGPSTLFQVISGAVS